MTKMGIDLAAFRRAVAGLAAAGLLSVALAGGVSADEAVAGNGGTSTSDASGGPLSIGTDDDDDDAETDTDESTGGTITVGDLGVFDFGDDIAASVIESVTGGDDDADDDGGDDDGGDDDAGGDDADDDGGED